MPVTSQPFAPAVQRLAARTPVASKLDSAQWQELALGLRERAFFSSGVESIRTVATMQSKLNEALTLAGGPDKAFMDRSKFVAEMRNELGAPDGDSGELTDISSRRRLELIHDFQTESAMEFGRFQAAQDPDLLDAFPCQELVRIEGRQKPRDWATLWGDKGGRFYAGRMIARKDDPIWSAISRFGTPYPPYDFGSGMGVEDVEREEAITLGVIQPDDEVQPQLEDFNAKLEASIPAAKPEVLEGFKQIFGDQVDVDRAGKITWQGTRIAKLYDSALADPAVKWSLDLGRTTPATEAAAKAAGVDLANTRLLLDADHVRHIEKRHGEAGEGQADQRPVTRLDVQLVPHVLREPDSVVPGKQAGDLVFSKDLLGRSVMATWSRQPNGTVRLRSLLVKTKGGQP